MKIIDDQIINLINSLESLRLILMAIAIGCMVIGFAFYWIPFEVRLYDDIIKTKLILNNVVVDYIKRRQL